jgi:hypothetical protein
MPGTGCCGIEYGCVVEWGVTKFVEYDDFWGDVWYNFKENSDIYKKCFEPIDEQESCTDDSIKEIIRKY